MRPASADRLLALLVLGMVVTGLATLRVGAPSGSWIFVLHGLLAGALAAAVAMKLRASVPRAVSGGRWARLAFGAIVSFAAVGALVAGYAWAASGRLLEVGSWTVLTLHAWLGLALVPLLVLHLLPRRWRLLRPRTLARETPAAALSRRSLLIGSALAISGVVAVTVAATADRLSGGLRRFTGSRWLPRDGIPPVTTFLGDTPPSVDPIAWRIAITGRVTRPTTLDVAALEAFGTTDLRATLDCTSGWAIDTTWRGTPLAALLAHAGAAPDATIAVRSATGWATTLSATDARAALIATHVAGLQLGVGNGAPVRLVVPDHRGLDWVKWVTAIRVV
jgi:hypothetical protein